LHVFLIPRIEDVSGNDFLGEEKGSESLVRPFQQVLFDFLDVGARLVRK
jgi:hypothetical protein